MFQDIHDRFRQVDLTLEKIENQQKRQGDHLQAIKEVIDR
jgi:hypothetical protein